MSYQIRVLTEDAELTRSLTVFMSALVGYPPPPLDGDPDQFFERGRNLGAFVDGELVGTASSFTSTLIVPGGARVRHAAVTDVGVLPTHTRRGLARALLEHQLQTIVERGEIVATLRASEAVIYERFGYGIASSAATVELRTAAARFRPGVPPGGPVRFVDPKTSWELLTRISATCHQVGTIERPGYWWRAQAAVANRDTGASYVVVHGEPGAEDGFVRYQASGSGSWLASDDRTVRVYDFVASTQEAFYGLLRFLLSMDLLHRVVLSTMPVDHAIEQLLFDDRAVRTTSVFDETWLRLVDVQAALAARSYRGTAAVTIAVRDQQLAANTGVYRVAAEGVSRLAAGARAELSLEVAALAAVYLGGTRWWQLALGGRVVEHREGALAQADELFAVDRAPFSGTMF